MTKIAPIRAETALLEPFPALGQADILSGKIIVPQTKAECAEAADAIEQAGVVGFDTESKPVFLKDTPNDGPHVVQFATPDKTYLFQLCHKECIPYVRHILQSDDIIKVGFGLRSDRGQLHSRLNVHLSGVLDMVTVFRKLGYRNEMGLASAVAIVFQQKFHKSKKTTTSNWGLRVLNEKQRIYAANDAYVALMVLHGLNLPRKEWPVLLQSQLLSARQPTGEL